jgi:hypothetical protein
MISSTQKKGRNIFCCSHLFDHAAMANQSKYRWTQNVVLPGLLKLMKGHLTCLPFAHRFYVPKKAIEAQPEPTVTGSDNVVKPADGQQASLIQ